MLSPLSCIIVHFTLFCFFFIAYIILHIIASILSLSINSGNGYCVISVIVNCMIAAAAAAAAIAVWVVSLLLLHFFIFFFFRLQKLIYWLLQSSIFVVVRRALNLFSIHIHSLTYRVRKYIENCDCLNSLCAIFVWWCHPISVVDRNLVDNMYNKQLKTHSFQVHYLFKSII